MTSAVPLQIDCTAFTRGLLAEALTDVTVLTELDADGPAGSFVAGLPYLRVLRIGGPDDGYALDIPTMGLHAFAANEGAAVQVCIQAVAALRSALGVVFQGAQITRVRKLGGPSYASADNPSVRHQVTLVQLRIKAA